jgi:hypothetical protein
MIGVLLRVEALHDRRNYGDVAEATSVGISHGDVAEATSVGISARRRGGWDLGDLVGISRVPERACPYRSAGALAIGLRRLALSLESIDALGGSGTHLEELIR